MQSGTTPSVDFQVGPVASRRDLRCFKRLPCEICSSQPGWVRPLKLARDRILDRRRHPFYARGRGAEAEFFLARSAGGEPVGRIAAILNHRYNARESADEGGPTGFFGFFECVNSPEVARALVGAAARWLRERGAVRMFGPSSPSQTYEFGLLVAGHDRPHCFLTAYQPAWYAELLEAAGLHPAKDLLGLSLDLHGPAWEKIWSRFSVLAEAAEESAPGEIAVRPADMRRFDREVSSVCDLLNRILAGLWGYAPIADEELVYMARSLRRFLMPEALLIVERRGEPIGGMLAVPDLNEIIGRLWFRIGPIELLELMLRARRWRPRCVRVLAAGVVPGWERSAAVPVMVAQLAENLLARGVQRVEAHLVLEDNKQIMVPLTRYGFRPDRRYRIYGCGLAAPPGRAERGAGS